MPLLDERGARLVGRAQEEHVLGSLVTGCVDGRSGVVAISGDPGLGKSVLLAHVMQLAREQGLLVLSGGPSGPGPQQAFGAFADPIRTLLDRSLRRARASAGGLAPEHETVLRDAVLGGPQGAPGAEQATVEALHEALAALLRAAPPRHGLLLSLDDLHRADSYSLGLLERLLRHPPGLSLALACAYRPRQAPARLLTGLRRAAGDYHAEWLKLAPLEESDAAAVLGRDRTAEETARLFALSEGNPLYLELLADGPSSSGPEALRAALAGELALLTDEELAVLRAAALFGDAFDAELLAPVAGLDADTALAALDQLARADLLRSDPLAPAWDSWKRLRLRHSLLREAVRQDIPPGWLLAACRRAEQALAESGAGPLERAPFVAAVGRVGDPTAVQLLVAASALVLHSAPQTAATWLRVALRLAGPQNGADEPQETGPWLEMLRALARASAACGDLPTARAALDQALELAPERETRVPVVVQRAILERLLGSGAAARWLLQDELTRWPDADPAAVPLLLQLAIVRMSQGAAEESAAHVEAVLVHPAPPAVPGGEAASATYLMLGAAHASQALAAAYVGDGVAALEHAGEAAALADSIGDDEMTKVLDEIGQLGWAEALAERYADAQAHLSRAARLAGRQGQGQLIPYLLLGQSYTQRAIGGLNEALRYAQEAEQAAHRVGRVDLAGLAVALQADALAFTKGPDAAAQYAERAVGSTSRRGRLWAISVAVLAGLRLDQDRLDDCVDLIRTVTDTGRSAVTHVLHAGWYSIAAQAEAARGDGAAARSWADLAVQAATAVGLRGQQGHASLALACLYPHDVVEAERHYGAAVADFAATGLVLAEARAHLLLGSRLAGVGRLDEARERIGRVKRIADRHGAVRLGTLAVNAQRKLGARQPRATGAEAALSPQEERVVALILRGASNRDVALELFVSVKTVEAHLTRIFRKLGVGSRRELVAELGPEETPVRP
jgi:DNA-binding CsgD family transcriptional regulator